MPSGPPRAIVPDRVGGSENGDEEDPGGRHCASPRGQSSLECPPLRAIPVEDARKLLGETAARCYDFDLNALRPTADRIGPTPEDLGQDPALRTDPEEVRSARWWKDEYQVQPPG